MNANASVFDPLDDLIEDYLERHRRGERPPLAEYTDAHPELAGRIRSLFPALLVMEAIGSGSGHAGDPRPDPWAEGPGDGEEPRRLGDYRLLRRVGSGGMGIVYEAIHESLGRHVALKTLVLHQLADPSRLERFRREARAAARLHHAQIVPVYGIGEHDGLHFYTMQFIRGHGLDAVLREVRRIRHTAELPPNLAADAPISSADRDGATEPAATATALFAELATRSGLHESPEARYVNNVARIGAAVAEALDYAHQEGVLHRDIKPANLLLDAQGNVWITDFGLAKLQDSGELTRTGDIVGTLRYMAPERFNGWSDPRSDVYALGATLYELLTLRPAFDESDRVKLVEKVLHQDPPPMRGLDRRIPCDLETIVLKAMAKEPGERYPTAGRLAEDLGRFVAGRPILARRSGAIERSYRWCGRNPLLAGAAGLAAASLAAVAIIAVLYAGRQREFADRQYHAARRISTLADQLGRSLADSERLLAIRNFDRGQAAFEKDRVGPGLLWMIESWRSAIEAGDPAWQHAARANLAAWRPLLPRLEAVLSHDSPVDAAAFSADGRFVLTGGDDQVARLWDAAAGQPVGPPLRHQGTVFAVAFSPDGRRVVTGAADRTARVWDRATGRPIGPPLPHDGEVRAVAFSPDGRTVLTGGTDRLARLWDAATGRPVGRSIRHRGIVLALAFSPDGASFLTADDSPGTVRRWNSATQAPVGRTIRQDRAISCAGFSTDGSTILTGTSDGIAWLWDAQTGVLRRRLTGCHESAVRAVAMGPDGTTILTAGTDRTARLWDVATGRPIGPRIRHEGPVVAAGFRPDGRAMLTASSDGTVRLHESPPREPDRPILVHGGSVSSVAFSRDGRTVVTGSWDGTARRWDSATGRPIGRPIDHGDCVSAVAMSPDGRTIVTGTGGPPNGATSFAARLWDAATGRPIGEPMVHDAAISIVAFNPDGRVVLTGGQDRMIRLWDARTAAPISRPLPQPGAVDGGAFSPDGRTFVAGYDSGKAQSWDVATLTPRPQVFPHPGAVSAVAISPDGRLLLTGCEDGNARLWDLERQSLRVPPLASAGWVFCVAISADGQTLLTGSREDAAARLWDASTGMPLGPPLRHPRGVTSVAFAPEGRVFATGSHDGGARLFPALRPVPDDLDRAAAWVGVVTGLSLDASTGSIRVLGNAEWQALRTRLEHLGGPPEVVSPTRAGSSAPDGETRSTDLPAAEQREETSPRMERWSLEEMLRYLNARWSSLARPR